MYVVVLMYKLTQGKKKGRCDAKCGCDIEKKLLKSFSFAIFKYLIIFFRPFAGICWIQ
jgi:hypothetical protein